MPRTSGRITFHSLPAPHTIASNFTIHRIRNAARQIYMRTALSVLLFCICFSFPGHCQRPYLTTKRERKVAPSFSRMIPEKEGAFSSVSRRPAHAAVRSAVCSRHAGFLLPSGRMPLQLCRRPNRNSQTIPCAVIAVATFSKPAMLAPAT